MHPVTLRKTRQPWGVSGQQKELGWGCDTFLCQKVSNQSWFLRTNQSWFLRLLRFMSCVQRSRVSALLPIWVSSLKFLFEVPARGSPMGLGGPNRKPDTKKSVPLRKRLPPGRDPNRPSEGGISLGWERTVLLFYIYNPNKPAEHLFVKNI